MLAGLFLLICVSLVSIKLHSIRRIVQMLLLMSALCITGTVLAATIQVPPGGGDFQCALKNASFRNTIDLQECPTYHPLRVGFTLPNKGPTDTDTNCLTIQSSKLAGISPTDQQIDPTQHAGAIARLASTPQ